jgi:hypothetical protein
VRSVLALLVALAMVAGALYVRSRGDGGGIPVITRDEPLTVVCATDLADVCRLLPEDGVTVQTQDAAATADALTQSPPPDIDGWLVTAPWPAIVDDRRARAGVPPLFGDVGAPVGRSPVVIAMWQDRAKVLTDGCDRDIFDCLGAAAAGNWVDIGGEARWGPVKVAHADPSRSGVGLNVIGAATASRLGKLDFNRADLDSDGFLDWFSRLERAVPQNMGAGGNLVGDMVAFGRSQYDAVGAVEAHAAPVLQRSGARGAEVRLFYPQPLVTVDVVLAPLQRSADRVRQVVGSAAPAVLAEAGWRVEGQQPATGVPSEPALGQPPQAPSAGALEALLERWGEVTR